MGQSSLISYSIPSADIRYRALSAEIFESCTYLLPKAFFSDVPFDFSYQFFGSGFFAIRHDALRERQNNPTCDENSIGSILDSTEERVWVCTIEKQIAGISVVNTAKAE